MAIFLLIGSDVLEANYGIWDFIIPEWFYYIAHIFKTIASTITSFFLCYIDATSFFSTVDIHIPAQFDRFKWGSFLLTFFHLDLMKFQICKRWAWGETITNKRKPIIRRIQLAFVLNLWVRWWLKDSLWRIFLQLQFWALLIKLASSI